MENSKIRKINLLRLMREYGLSQAEVAIRANTSAVYISQCLSEKIKADIGPHVARKLEIAFNKPRGWLDTPHFDIDNSSQWTTNPLSSSSDVSAKLSGCPILEIDSIEDWIRDPVIKEKHKTLQLTPNFDTNTISNKCFWYTITEGNMIHLTNPQKSLFPGDLVLVDPERIKDLKVGQLVIAKFGEGDIRVREYQKDGKESFLRAFEPQIPIKELDEQTEILGVIVAVNTFRNMLG